VAFDEELAERIRGVLGDRVDVDERRMFGGIAFLLNGDMCCGIVGDELIARLGPEAAEQALAEPGVRPFDFTGRPSRGIVFVAPEAIAEDSDLDRWIGRAEEFAGALPPK
jgi:hypothetical protein